MRRTTYGQHRYQAQVTIQGQRILLGYFEFRSQAAQAEEIAGKIRDALSRAAPIKRKMEVAR